VSETNGEVVVLLNSDAEVEPESLAAVASAFADDGTLGIAGAALRYPDGTPQWSAGREPNLLWLFAQASGLPALLGRLPGWRRVKPLHVQAPADVGWVSGAAMALRTAVWRAHGTARRFLRFLRSGPRLLLPCPSGRLAGAPPARVSRDAPARRDDHVERRRDDRQPRPRPPLGRLRRVGLQAGRAVFAARARAAILAGSGLRLAARRAALPFLPERRRREWKTVTALLATARSRLFERASGGRASPSTAG
jgi:hypothetical protein